MKDKDTKLIRCDIYAGGTRIRTFPDDRALQILKAHKRDGALVLVCRDASGRTVEVETTLRYLLIKSVDAQPMEDAASAVDTQAAVVQ